MIICENNTKTSYKRTNNADEGISGPQLCSTEEGQLGWGKPGVAGDGQSGEDRLHTVGQTYPYSESPSQGLPHSEAGDKLEVTQTRIRAAKLQKLHRSFREEPFSSTSAEGRGLHEQTKTKLLHKFVNPCLILTLLHLWQGGGNVTGMLRSGTQMRQLLQLGEWSYKVVETGNTFV